MVQQGVQVEPDPLVPALQSELTSSQIPGQYQLFPPQSTNPYMYDSNLTPEQQPSSELFHWETDTNAEQGLSNFPQLPPPPSCQPDIATQVSIPTYSHHPIAEGAQEFMIDMAYNNSTSLSLLDMDNPIKTSDNNSTFSDILDNQITTTDIPYSNTEVSSILDNPIPVSDLPYSSSTIPNIFDNPISTTASNCWNLESRFQETPSQVSNALDQTRMMQDQPSEASPISSDRRKSTDSSGAESEASGYTFNSAYTDTISSIHSTDQLLKREDDTDEEPGEHGDKEPVNEIYFNCGYSSYSSSETLDSKEAEKDQSEKVALWEIPKIEISVMETETTTAEGKVDEQTAEALQDFVHHHLIPISENEIISFTAEEIEPSTYTKITNNITVVDESFLFMSQTSLNDADGKSDKRAATMNNLHERNSFLDLTDITKVGRACQRALLYLKDDITFGSVASINTLANKGFEKEAAQSISLIDGSKTFDIVPSTRHTRNLVYLSFCITLLFIAIGSVRNLQSSINHEGGVGVISMAVAYIGYMSGSIFSASILQNFQPRMCIIINLIPNLLYVAANIYPAIWLMVPVSFVQGVSLAILWNAMSTYITFLARGRAQKKNEKLEDVSARYFGLFCLFYQSYLIVGNLIASLVLMFGNSGSAAGLVSNNSIINASVQADLGLNKIYEPGLEMPLPVELNPIIPDTPSTNLTLNDVEHLHLCGAAFCNHYELGGGGFTVSDQTKYILFGIYFGCIILAMLIAIFLLEPLNLRLFSSSVSRVQRIKTQLLSMCQFTTNRNFLLLLPLLMYSVMQFGFITAEVSMAFVTCPLGIHMVGYTMIVLGVCGSISSYISGLLNKFTGRAPPILFAAALNLGALITMSLWQPTVDSLVPYFIIMGIWGVGDGIWISQVNCLMGNIFPDKYEEAYAGLRVAQGLGVAITFGYSNSLCMAVKIYIMAAICIISVIGYLIMEFLLKRESKSKPFVLKQTSV